jgi:predicted extracellular nuclease
VINIPVDLTPLLNQQKADILQSISDNATSTQSAVNTKASETQSQLATKTAEIVAEANENQAILSGLTAVNGELDSTASAIIENTNTNAANTVAAIEAKSVIKSIQRGTTLVPVGRTVDTIAISTVDPQKANIDIEGVQLTVSNSLHEKCYGEITSSNTIRLVRRTSSYTVVVSWEVIEYV